MKGLVYIDKHVQPSHNLCFSSLMEKYYGNYTPEITKTYIVPIEQTGDMHIAIYDYKENLVFVANASPYINSSFIPAYNRPFIQLNMTRLFNEKPTAQL